MQNYPLIINNYLPYLFHCVTAGGIPPPVLKIKTLKSLVLKYHVLKFIPDEIKDLTSLKELDIEQNPQLTSLSAELSGLPLKSKLQSNLC